VTEVRTNDVGDVVVRASAYRLELAASGMVARLSSPQGEPWAALRPLAAFDTAQGPDETVAVGPPRIGGDGIVAVERSSTRWEHASTRFVCTDDAVEVVSSVKGGGALTEVHLLAARSTIAGAPTGFMPSGTSFRTLFSPNPGDPGRLVRPAAEAAVIGVSGDGQPGRGHWFFTPAPLSFWLTTAEPREPSAVDEGWVGVSLAAPVEQLTFVQVAYVSGDRAFSLRFDYEGHTIVDGEFDAPALLITPGARDPYEGLRRHRRDLVDRGAAPPAEPRHMPEWWSAPIFCGWGAQGSLARRNGTHYAALATQANYDDFLAHLEGQGLVPGTVVIDDKWQLAYGTNEPDPEKWPDLRGWIDARRELGQHVVLWWKAWDPEGVQPDLCVRNAEGEPVALDPTNPQARAFLRDVVHRLLGRDGLDADGLKVDFTARTPSGSVLTTHGPGWGIALLHALLAIVYAAAKDAKSDALVITHTPHPAFVDVTDMIRLNDMLRLDDPAPLPPVVPQMRYRAAVVKSACPELLIDTDDWSAPSLAEWRRYLEAKLLLGIPSLYYADALDSTGEEFDAEDYRALRDVWAEWQERRGSGERISG
jgi:hypothetical protein